VKLLLKQEQM